MSKRKISKKINITTKNTEQTRCIEKTLTHKFLSPLVGKHREQLRRRPRVGRPPDHLRYVALDLERRREGGAVIVPVQGARSAVISQGRSGRLQSSTTLRAWYYPRTSAKVTPDPRTRLSTAQ
jgi:hypothetical protein